MNVALVEVGLFSNKKVRYPFNATYRKLKINKNLEEQKFDFDTTSPQFQQVKRLLIKDVNSSKNLNKNE